MRVFKGDARGCGREAGERAGLFSIMERVCAVLLASCVCEEEVRCGPVQIKAGSVGFEPYPQWRYLPLTFPLFNFNRLEVGIWYDFLLLDLETYRLNGRYEPKILFFNIRYRSFLLFEVDNKM